MRVAAIWKSLLLLGVWSAAGLCHAASFEETLAEADRIRSADPERFGTLLAQLDLAQAQASRVQQERLRYLKAYESIVYRNEFDEGIQQATALFRDTRDLDLKFRAGSLAANSYAVKRNFTEGLRLLNQTLSMRQRVRDSGIRNDGVNAAAMLYNQLGQYRLGLQYAQETLSGDPGARAACYAGFFRLEALFYLNKLQGSDADANRIVDSCNGLGERIIANLSRIILARKWAQEGRRGAAIALLEKHLPEVDTTRYAQLRAEIHSLLAELKLAEGDTVSAETHAAATASLGKTSADSLPLVVAYKILYAIAQQRGDQTEAFENFRLYANAERAHMTDVKARALAYEIVRHETLQKTQEIELLNRKNEVLRLQQKVDKQIADNARIVIALLLALIGAVLYWAYRVKRMEQSLRYRADTDALTGISNRQHFTLQAEQAVQRCAAAGEELALIMFDLDHFKSINDRYGHHTGDWVLGQVAKVCRSLCRDMDELGRLGGEEFAILQCGQDLRGATRLAEDCRMRLCAIDTRETGHAFHISASFGVTTTTRSGYALTDLLADADRLMYEAKGAGRDRVCAEAVTGAPKPAEAVARKHLHVVQG